MQEFLEQVVRSDENSEDWKSWIRLARATACETTDKTLWNELVRNARMDPGRAVARAADLVQVWREDGLTTSTATPVLAALNEGYR